MLRSEDLSYYAFPFGQTGDVPSTADYDGDGKTDIAIYRDGTGWRFYSSTGSVEALRFGLANDKPVPAAYLSK